MTATDLPLKQGSRRDCSAYSQLVRYLCLSSSVLSRPRVAIAPRRPHSSLGIWRQAPSPDTKYCPAQPRIRSRLGPDGIQRPSSRVTHYARAGKGRDTLCTPNSPQVTSSFSDRCYKTAWEVRRTALPAIASTVSCRTMARTPDPILEHPCRCHTAHPHNSLMFAPTFTRRGMTSHWRVPYTPSLSRSQSQLLWCLTSPSVK